MGVNFYQNLIDKKQLDSNVTIFFFIMYFILFLILVNIIIITICHSKIINKTGPTGPVGFKGNRGISGYDGECNSDCYKIELRMELINHIQEVYNELLKKNNKEQIDILQKINDPKTKKLINIKLKNNLLNSYVENITYSQQYNDAKSGNKTVTEVNSYIKSIIEKWITLIYNELRDSNKFSKSKEHNFFLDKYANNNNTNWKRNINPFEDIQKYDLYNWGKTRVFKPLSIYIDNNPNNNNYLPQDGKPPLKLLHTNHYKYLYENKTHETRDEKIKKEISKYPNNEGSIWQNNNVVKYKKEDYYPVGDLIIGPQNNYKKSTESYIKDPDNNEIYKFSTLQDKNLDSFNSKGRRKFKMKGCRQIRVKVPWDKGGGFMRGKNKIEKIVICPRGNQLNLNSPDKETILVTGDVAKPNDYEKMWDNTNSYEKTNLTIWRPKCPYGYESLSDIASLGTDKPKKNDYRCVPKKCLKENTKKLKTILKTFDNKEIVGYSDVNNDLHATDNNSYNFFRFKTKDQKQLYTINKQCKTTADTKAKEVEDRYRKLGYGWHGRPVRNPKYSIFSYLVQMPEAIISSKTTNYKYYIVHVDLYNNDDSSDAKLKTSAKNLYYILTLNYNNFKYDRCFSTFGNENELIRTRIRSEDQSYWIIEPVNQGDTSNTSEIRLKSKKTGKYFAHNRNHNLRRDLVKNRVFEKQVTLNEIEDKDSSIFVNIKSAFGTNVESAIEDSIPRLEHKYYLNDEKNIINTSYDKNHIYPKRGIQPKK